MHKIKRREALKLIGSGSACLAGGALFSCGGKKQHIVTLSFDDGFEKSSIETARIYEKYGLSASINVIATAHLKGFELPNEYHAWPSADFELWNELQERGHEIMPHTYKHVNLTQVPFEQATSLIMKCFGVFVEELKGFRQENSVYVFAHNASTPELEEWLGPRVRAFRTAGGAFNPLPYKGQKKLTCGSHGPENIDRALEKDLNDFLDGPSGWFIYNTHGLDNEGWGPMSSGFLDELLDKLVNHETASVLSMTQALDLAKGRERKLTD
ncbi:MAG: polysaccharide deacetylase family protein [Bacteroidales bacterium]